MLVDILLMMGSAYSAARVMLVDIMLILGSDFSASSLMWLINC